MLIPSLLIRRLLIPRLLIPRLLIRGRLPTGLRFALLLGALLLGALIALLGPLLRLAAEFSTRPLGRRLLGRRLLRRRLVGRRLVGDALRSLSRGLQRRLALAARMLPVGSVLDPWRTVGWRPGCTVATRRASRLGGADGFDELTLTHPADLHAQRLRQLLQLGQHHGVEAGTPAPTTLSGLLGLPWLMA